MKSINKAKIFGKYIPVDLLVSLYAPASEREEVSNYSELIPDRSLSVEDDVLYRMAWEQVYREFSPLELELLEKIIHKERTQRELAKKYNMSQTSIVRREKAVKEKTRRIFFGTQN